MNPQILPAAPGEVEHAPEAIWESQLAVAHEAAIVAAQVAAESVATAWA